MSPRERMCNTHALNSDGSLAQHVPDPHRVEDVSGCISLSPFVRRLTADPGQTGDSLALVSTIFSFLKFSMCSVAPNSSGQMSLKAVRAHPTTTYCRWMLDVRLIEIEVNGRK